MPIRDTIRESRRMDSHRRDTGLRNRPSMRGRGHDPLARRVDRLHRAAGSILTTPPPIVVAASTDQARPVEPKLGPLASALQDEIVNALKATEWPPLDPSMESAISNSRDLTGGYTLLTAAGRRRVHGCEVVHVGFAICADAGGLGWGFGRIGLQPFRCSRSR